MTSDAVEDVTSAEKLAEVFDALPRRLEEAAGILADMTPEDLGRPVTKQAIAMMVMEMRMAATLLRAINEPVVTQ